MENGKWEMTDKSFFSREGGFQSDEITEQNIGCRTTNCWLKSVDWVKSM